MNLKDPDTKKIVTDTKNLTKKLPVPVPGTILTTVPVKEVPGVHQTMNWTEIQNKRPDTGNLDLDTGKRAEYGA
jgi:hypothetical protein